MSLSFHNIRSVPHQESDKHRDILTAGAFQRQVDRALKSKDIGFKKKMVRETQLETASASLEAPTTGNHIFIACCYHVLDL